MVPGQTEPPTTGEQGSPPEGTEAPPTPMGQVPATTITTLMQAANMLTHAAHVINERSTKMEKLNSELVAQQVVISRNLTDFVGRLEVVEKHLGIKPPKTEAAAAEKVEELKGLDPELLRIITTVESEATEQADAVKKDLIKKKLAERLKPTGQRPAADKPHAD